MVLFMSVVRSTFLQFRMLVGPSGHYVPRLVTNRNCNSIQICPPVPVPGSRTAVQELRARTGTEIPSKSALQFQFLVPDRRLRNLDHAQELKLHPNLPFSSSSWFRDLDHEQELKFHANLSLSSSSRFPIGSSGTSTTNRN